MEREPDRQAERQRERREAIGYVRVSTDLQANDGIGLERQIQRLRDWCLANGYVLVRVYEDVGSAVGPRNLKGRPDFQQAVREALQAGVPLIVSDIARLSRDREILETLVIEPGLRVISIMDGGEVPVGVMLQRVGEAEDVACRIAQGTREALSRVAETRPLGARGGHRQAARASAVQRVDRKVQVLGHVADHFEARPGLMEATSQAIADSLNEAGILTGWGRAWTASAVRGTRDEIGEELAFRRREEQDDAPAAGASVSAPSTVLSTKDDARAAAGWPSAPAKVQAAAPTAGKREHDEADVDEDERLLRQNPLYGIF